MVEFIDVHVACCTMDKILWMLSYAFSDTMRHSVYHKCDCVMEYVYTNRTLYLGMKYGSAVHQTSTGYKEF